MTEFAFVKVFLILKNRSGLHFLYDAGYSCFVMLDTLTDCKTPQRPQELFMLSVLADLLYFFQLLAVVLLAGVAMTIVSFQEAHT